MRRSKGAYTIKDACNEAQKKILIYPLKNRAPKKWYFEEEACVLPEDLSARTVAQILGVSIQTVQRYCVDGKLKATRMPGLAGEWRICTQEFLGQDRRYLSNLTKILEERAERNRKLAEAVAKLADRPGYQKLLDGIGQRRTKRDKS